ncbi:hypothetical protein [Methylocystis sp.]|uniref:hypothetical protein n=1 Tax=Methylocystis sp. TaxID=1911079 RepID=UPI0025E64826|nr:hypothetical protein [Methylocystis sp.]
MPDHLDWFTTDIFPDGTQKVHIRPRDSSSSSETLQLDHPQSQILMATLGRLAQDTTIPWSAARQATLQGFWKALRASF